MGRNQVVTTELSRAWEFVLGKEPDQADALTLLSSFLFELKNERGLAKTGSTKRIEALLAKHPAQHIAQQLLQLSRTPDDLEEAFSDLLYPALVAIAGNSELLKKSLDRMYLLEDHTVLALGQLYWNIVHSKDDRPALPMNPRESNVIPAPGGGDFSVMSWNERMAKGLTTHKGNTLRKKGANLAVLAAQEILKAHPDHLDFPQQATLVRRADGRITAIQWGDDTEAQANILALEGIDAAMRADAQASLGQGRVADAAFMFDLLVQQIRRRSEEEFGEHEVVLARISAEAGFAHMTSGQYSEALGHFARAVQICSFQAALSPGSVTVNILHGLALFGQSTTHVATDEIQLAESSLIEAVELLQDVRSEDTLHTALLAVILGQLGGIEALSERFNNAEKTLTRAERLITHINKAELGDEIPTVATIQILFARAGIHLSTGNMRRLEQTATQALNFLDNDETIGSLGLHVHLLRGSLLWMLTVCLIEQDRLDEAQTALTTTRDEIEKATASPHTQSLLDAIEALEQAFRQKNESP